jgi:tetratricopeptide (TPR) repeat protein
MVAFLGGFYLFGGGLLGMLFLAFTIWMLIDAVRRDEMIWALFILLFPIINAPLYFFLVYRGGGGFSTRGFELPGAHDRRRIKELQDQIHHLDKPHHHAQLGDIYFQQGKLAKAEECYLAARQRDPDDLDTRAHYGQCLLRLGRPKEALPLLESVRAQNPRHDYGHTLMALAETYTQLGERERAQAAWGEVLQHNSYARARVQLAALYLAQQLKPQARELVQEVISDDRHAPGFQRRRDKVWVRQARRLLKQCST